MAEPSLAGWLRAFPLRNCAIGLRPFETWKSHDEKTMIKMSFEGKQGLKRPNLAFPFSIYHVKVSKLPHGMLFEAFIDNLQSFWRHRAIQHARKPLRRMFYSTKGRIRLLNNRQNRGRTVPCGLAALFPSAQLRSRSSTIWNLKKSWWKNND